MEARNSLCSGTTNNLLWLELTLTGKASFQLGDEFRQTGKSTKEIFLMIFLKCYYLLSTDYEQNLQKITSQGSLHT